MPTVSFSALTNSMTTIVLYIRFSNALGRSKQAHYYSPPFSEDLQQGGYPRTFGKILGYWTHGKTSYDSFHKFDNIPNLPLFVLLNT